MLHDEIAAAEIRNIKLEQDQRLSDQAIVEQVEMERERLERER